MDTSRTLTDILNELDKATDSLEDVTVVSKLEAISKDLLAIKWGDEAFCRELDLKRYYEAISIFRYCLDSGQKYLKRKTSSALLGDEIGSKMGPLIGLAREFADMLDRLDGLCQKEGEFGYDLAELYGSARQLACLALDPIMLQYIGPIPGNIDRCLPNVVDAFDDKKTLPLTAKVMSSVLRSLENGLVRVQRYLDELSKTKAVDVNFGSYLNTVQKLTPQLPKFGNSVTLYNKLEKVKEAFEAGDAYDLAVLTALERDSANPPAQPENWASQDWTSELYARYTAIPDMIGVLLKSLEFTIVWV